MMEDTVQFGSPEEVREYLRSELYRTDGSAIERMDNIHELLHSLKTEPTGIDFDEVVGPLVAEWCNDNPDVAQGLAHVVNQLSSVMNEAARPLGLILSQVTTALEEWVRNNPKVVQKIVATFEIFTADGQAAQWRDRYYKDGVAIPFDRAVRLAFCLMALRIPYGGDRCPDEGGLTQVYDFEMRAVYALKDGRLRELMEGSQVSPLDFRALQAVLSSLRKDNKPIPSELNEWALDVASGDVKCPRVRPGRSPYTNVVRDELITKTVQTLVDCGLSTTRNEVSDPESACDAVSEALNAHGVELSFDAVAKIRRSYRSTQKGNTSFPTSVDEYSTPAPTIHETGLCRPHGP